MIEIVQRIEDKFIFVFKKPEYIRRGQCQHSGTCCRHLGMQIPEPWMRRPWLVRYLVWWHRYRFNFQYLGKTEEILIYECDYITKGNLCSIYKWRPRLCRDFPKVQLWGFSKLHRGCGFRFTRRGRADFVETLEREKKKNS